MNRIVLAVVFFLSMFTNLTVFAVQNLPGGIAMLSANKNVVFYPFDGSTPQVLGSAPQGVFAVAKNGDLIVVDQSQFQVTKYVDNGKSQSTKTVTYVRGVENQKSRECEKVPCQITEPISNLAFAPNGNGFSFEVDSKVLGYSLEPSGSCEIGWKARIGNNAGDPPALTWSVTLAPQDRWMFANARFGSLGA